METRKEALRALKACRFCLRRGSLVSIYDKTRHKSAVSLPLQIMACVNIEVYPSDGMPSQICERCLYFIKQGYQFKQLCRSADEALLQYLQTGESLEPVPWPHSLKKNFPQGKRGKSGAGSHEKHQEALVKGAAGQDGVKVEVSANSDVDTDDEDVFNIKIETEDGAEGAKGSGLARIKVTQHDGELHITQEGDDAQDADVEMCEEGGAKADGSMEAGRFACDACHRTFALQQLLTLHKERHHRQRPAACPVCPEKFFSKYDMISHLGTHSDETPFQCVACGQHFKRYGLLKKHERTKHSDMPQFRCTVCPASFLSQEERVAHSVRHRNYNCRAHKCDQCDNRFQNKAALNRHVEIVHHKKDTFSCNYCPEKFSTAVRLARHVTEHVGERPYLCKYCSKTFTKSHHYTRHLRLKHSEVNSTDGAAGEIELYQCTECDESFTTQETLAYHEAKHAAQNMTCPLCQEHFDNVDEVTDHVKLHADQEKQYECDFCELVFISEPRLDKHMCEEHSAELDEQEGLMEEAEEYEMEVKHLDEAIESSELPDLSSQSEIGAKPITAEILEENTDGEETTYTELSTVDTLHIASLKSTPSSETLNKLSESTPTVQSASIESKTSQVKTAGILRKAEEVKRRAQEEKASRPPHSPSKHQRLNSSNDDGATITKTKLAKLDKPKEKEKDPNNDPKVDKCKQENGDKTIEENKNSNKGDNKEKDDKHKDEKKERDEKNKGDKKERDDKNKDETIEKDYKNKDEKKEIDYKNKEDKKIDKDNKKIDRGDKKIDKDNAKLDREEKKIEKDDKKEDKKLHRMEKKCYWDEKKEDREEKRVNRDDKTKEVEQKKPEREEIKVKTEREETPSEKSLRILERDLQELKRTSARGAESSEDPPKRRGRPPLTPAQKADRIKSKVAQKVGRSSPQASTSNSDSTPRKPGPLSRDKRLREEERESPRERGLVKDEKQIKQETESSDTPTRRSSRASKVQDYAKMVKDSGSSSSEEEEEEEEEESEESDEAATPPPPPKRRGRPPKHLTCAATSAETSASPFATETTPAPPRPRGRPPSGSPHTLNKKRKLNEKESSKSSRPAATAAPASTPASAPPSASVARPLPAGMIRTASSNVMLTPSGQTLTKVPASVIKSLPPGMKPLPLPAKLQPSVAAAASGSICEMKMGEKTVKVQKIVMTKAEVEEMYKKGLLEMKHGTMVLKAPKLPGGAKLPTGDANAIRTLMRAAAAPAPAPAPQHKPDDSSSALENRE